jgi:hypothetical protein
MVLRPLHRFAVPLPLRGRRGAQSLSPRRGEYGEAGRGAGARRKTQ